jgi:hypothetical protein
MEISTLTDTHKIYKCINLTYLRKITRSNPDVMTKMLALYIRQVPALLASLRKGYDDQNCKLVFESSHQLIPSFSIVGLDAKYELMSKQIQHSASAGCTNPEMHQMIVHLENICHAACCEVVAELKSRPYNSNPIQHG